MNYDLVRTDDDGNYSLKDLHRGYGGGKDIKPATWLSAKDSKNSYGEASGKLAYSKDLGTLLSPQQVPFMAGG